jgi:glycosyltransferase involved in cell wall biosynthesis
MKILFISFNSHPCHGGVDTYLRTLRAGLSIKGHQADLLCLSDIYNLKQESLAMIAHFSKTLRERLGDDIPLATEEIKYAFKTLFRELDLSTYDVIHSQNGILNSVIKECYPDIPLVGTIHGCIYSEWGNDSKLDKFFRDYDLSAVNLPDKVITVSSYVDKNLPPIPSEKHQVIYNGVDVSFFTPQEKSNSTLKFATSGFFNHIKGYDILLNALASLKGDGLPCKLTMFGDGTEMARLSEFAFLHHLPVTFKGVVSREELQQQLPSFDVFIQPSRLENFPFAVIEAMSSGCAVICSKINGMQEQVKHRRSGLLFEPENVEQLAECIRYVITHREQTAKMGIQARKSAEKKFSTEAMVRKYEKVYKELKNERRRQKENTNV